VQLFSCDEINLRFSHVAATMQKMAGHGTRGVLKRGKGGAISQMAARVPESPNNVTSIPSI